MGPPLVPKGELFRNDGILIDHRFDLQRTEGQPLFGQLIQDDLPVFGKIAFGAHPGDHIVLALGV